MNLTELKKCNFRVRMNIRGVYKIIQWKEGCVYKTKSIGFIVCKSDYQFLSSETTYQLSSVSTKITRELM